MNASRTSLRKRKRPRSTRPANETATIEGDTMDIQSALESVKWAAVVAIFGAALALAFVRATR